jgi:hypothetical protein
VTSRLGTGKPRNFFYSVVWQRKKNFHSVIFPFAIADQNFCFWANHGLWYIVLQHTYEGPSALMFHHEWSSAVPLTRILKQFGLKSHNNNSTLQRQFRLYISFLGIARPQPQFPHSCVFERFIYSQDQFTYFLQQNRQTHRGNI